MTTKDKILLALEGLPEDGDLNETILDALDRLLLLYKIEQSIAQADARDTIPHEEVVNRMQRWQK